MPLPTLKSLLTTHILLFPHAPPPPSPTVQVSPGFSTCPQTEQEAHQNRHLHTASQTATIPTVLQAALPRPLLALALPRALHNWLCTHIWNDISHAILCILHDATCSAPQWRNPAQFPARLAPSVAQALSALPPHHSHCSKGELDAARHRCGRSVPLVTPASRVLDDLLQRFAGERLWTVPVYAVVDNDGEGAAFVRALMPHWRRYRRLAMRKHCVFPGDVSVGFMDVVREGRLGTFWRQVDAVCSMAGPAAETPDGERGEGRRRCLLRGVARAESSRITKPNGRRKRNNFFALLPEEVLTEHIIPSLCLCSYRASLLRSLSDGET